MAERTTAHVEGRIFISYRRQESAYAAGWLYDRLAERFGAEQIFKDVDSIELGDDFVKELGEAVGAADVFLALIGDRWLTVADDHGVRRLEDPDDFVRLELEAALTRKMRIIPILVEGAHMPREDELPPSLRPLARRQALELSPSRFSADTGRLLHALEAAVVEARAAQVSEPSGSSTPPVGATSMREAEPRKANEAAASATVRVARRARPIAVTLALAGAGLGIISNTDTLLGSRPGAFEAFAPERLGTPLLVAALAILLQAGRIREPLGYGLLLGFGLLTAVGAIGMGLVSEVLDGGQGDAPLALFVAGFFVLAAGMVGTVGVVRSPGAWGTPFRWGPASLLAVVGALVAVGALFVDFGQSDAGNGTSVENLGGPYGLTGLVLQPIVAIATACAATYALGKGGAVRLLAAGVILAVGVATALFYGNLLEAVRRDYVGHWLHGNWGGFLVGFGVAVLFAAAGLVGRRSS